MLLKPSIGDRKAKSTLSEEFNGQENAAEIAEEYVPEVED